jgi:site-specific DNA-methyltransferase (adenine-specific)
LAKAALPFGEGVILDPFMGSGSTIAACAAEGVNSIGIEKDELYFRMSKTAIPKLAALPISTESDGA